MKILAINPGSTSTKYALYSDRELLFDQTLRHTNEELSRFASINGQLEWREEVILDDLKQRGVELSELSAVVGRGGLVKPIEGGLYEVNEALLKDSRDTEDKHASNLGSQIAHSIANREGCSARAFIADPVVVDELEPLARVGGHPLLPRHSVFHALNTKAIAKHYALDRGVRYEDLNLVVAHLGGGASVCVHSKGRVIDTNNALSGDGTFAVERCGRVEPLSLARLCFSGEYSEADITKMLVSGGGLVAHLGINSMADAVKMALAGDSKAKLIVDAFCYNVAKDIGAMSCVLSGKVDAIVITGGIAYNDHLMDQIKERVGWIAPVAVFPGEDELEALAMSALNYLEGKSEVKVYK